MLAALQRCRTWTVGFGQRFPVRLHWDGGSQFAGALLRADRGKHPIIQVRHRARAPRASLRHLSSITSSRPSPPQLESSHICHSHPIRCCS